MRQSEKNKSHVSNMEYFRKKVMFFHFTNINRRISLVVYDFWCVEMGDLGDCPRQTKHEKTLILHMLREMWLNGDVSLHRIYSSWDQLEANLEITTDTATQKHTIAPCPSCRAKQKINLPFEGIFPYQTCQSCRNPFYVNKDLTIRRLTEEEKKELPGAWIQVVEGMNKQRVAVVFRLE